MAALAWLGIPVAAGVIAVLWAAWAARPPKATGDGASLAEHQRFLAAMERSTGSYRVSDGHKVSDGQGR